MNYSSLQKLLIIVLAGAISISCSNDSEINQNMLNDIVSFTPNEIRSFDHIEGNYFSHLGYESKVLENGNIVFADRQLSNIFVISPEGELRKLVRQGRGPGEILDAYSFTVNSEGHLFTYDQDNNKLLEFDDEFEFFESYFPQEYGSSTVSYAYEVGKGNFVFELHSFEYLNNPDKTKEKVFVQYDDNKEEFGKEWSVADKPYAILRIAGRVVGAGNVPFAFDQLTYPNANNNSIFIFNTDSPFIAEIDANYDTLNTIPVNVPIEKVNSAERDSIEQENRKEQWDTMEDMIPETKTQADKMLYHDGKFWLKSNLRGNYQKWFVVNMDGQILRAVNLPKESILMHVSDEHLGVRMDDVTFALYENPISEVQN